MTAAGRICRACDEPIVTSGGLADMCNRCYLRARRDGLVERGEALLPPPAVFVDVSWHVDALCAETDPEVFFPEKGQSTKDAKATCGQCLVRAECLTYALDTGQRFGVWGGRSERERRKLLGLGEDDAEEASAA